MLMYRTQLRTTRQVDTGKKGGGMDVITEEPINELKRIHTPTGVRIVKISRCSCNDSCGHKNVYAMSENGEIYHIDNTSRLAHLKSAENKGGFVDLFSTKLGTVALNKDGTVEMLDSLTCHKPLENILRLLDTKNQEEGKFWKITKLDISYNSAAAALNDNTVIYSATEKEPDKTRTEKKDENKVNLPGSSYTPCPGIFVKEEPDVGYFITYRATLNSPQRDDNANLVVSDVKVIEGDDRCLEAPSVAITHAGSSSVILVDAKNNRTREVVFDSPVIDIKGVSSEYIVQTENEKIHHLPGRINANPLDAPTDITVRGVKKVWTSPSGMDALFTSNNKLQVIYRISASTMLTAQGFNDSFPILESPLPSAPAQVVIDPLNPNRSSVVILTEDGSLSLILADVFFALQAR